MTPFVAATIATIALVMSAAAEAISAMTDRHMAECPALTVRSRRREKGLAIGRA